MFSATTSRAVSIENSALSDIVKESWFALQRLYMEGFAMTIGLEDTAEVSLIFEIWRLANVKPHFYSSPLSASLLAERHPIIYQFCIEKKIAIIRTS